MAKKASQGSQTKVETLTIRISPKMKFGLELLSRKQHRTLTSVAEWALNKALMDGRDGICVYDINGNTVENMLETAWDPCEADRLIKLAVNYPQLLTYEEELLWKLIRECEFLWINYKSISNMDYQIKHRRWDFIREYMNFGLLHRYYSDLQESVDNLEMYHHTMQLLWAEICEADRLKEKSKPKKRAPQDSDSTLLTDDDIPF